MHARTIASNQLPWLGFLTPLYHVTEENDPDLYSLAHCSPVRRDTYAACHQLEALLAGQQAPAHC
jgi:hypothetical protein